MNTVKNLLLGLLFLSFLYSCDQDGEDNLTPIINTENDLIGAIQSASNLQSIGMSDLPTNVQTLITQDHANKFLQNAKAAEGLGYEVNLRMAKGFEMGKRTQIYFDSNGKELEQEKEVGEDGDEEEYEAFEECFEIIFPISVTMPDATEITLNEENDYKLIEDWYEANKEVDEEPELIFPISIEFDEDEIVVIENEEELDDILEMCEEYCHDDDYEEEWECFDIKYPFSVTMPDGSTITLNDDADYELVEAWYEANPTVDEEFALVYPVTIVFEDGEELIINNEEELESIEEKCYNEWEEELEEECFEIVFPFSVTMPDGSTIVLNDDEDYELVEAWYEANPDVKDEPELVFPVIVVFDDERLEINNEEEFERLEDACEDYWDDYEEEWECFEIEFPFSLTLPDGSTITLNNEDDYEKVEKWYDANPEVEDDPALVFPVVVVFEDGKSVTVNNEEEFERIEEACDDE